MSSSGREAMQKIPEPTGQSPGIVAGVFERFTDRARSVLVLAQDEARQLHHGYIGTEHILLGLMRRGDGVGADVLTSFDITLDSVRNEVRAMLGEVHDPTAQA